MPTAWPWRSPGSWAVSASWARRARWCPTATSRSHCGTGPDADREVHLLTEGALLRRGETDLRRRPALVGGSGGRFPGSPGDHRRLPRHRAGGLRAGCRHGGRALREGPRLPGLALAVQGGALLPGPHCGPRRRAPSILDAIRARKPAVLEAVAKSWNAGFRLSAGPLDPARFVALGPYRAESFDPKSGLRLVPNDKWWGQAPAVRNIVVTAATPMQLRAHRPWRIRRHRHRRGHRRPGGGSGDWRSQVSPAGHSLSVEQVVLAQRACSARRRPVRRSAHACRGTHWPAPPGTGRSHWNLHVLTPASDLADPITRSSVCVTPVPTSSGHVKPPVSVRRCPTARHRRQCVSASPTSDPTRDVPGWSRPWPNRAAARESTSSTRVVSSHRHGPGHGVRRASGEHRGELRRSWRRIRRPGAYAFFRR